MLCVLGAGCPAWPAELHVVDGVPSFIFVQAKYTVEVGGWVGGWLGGWLGGWAGGGWVVLFFEPAVGSTLQSECNSHLLCLSYPCPACPALLPLPLPLSSPALAVL